MAQPGGPSFSGLRICVIGAGGLGCAVLPRMARMNIAGLTMIDGDRVEMHNLDRQPLYDEMDIGRYKAATAAAWMRQIATGADIIAHDVFLDAGNARDLLHGNHVVVEGVDDLHAKQLIDRVCGELRIPLVSGGVHATQGQVLVLHAHGEGEGLTRADVFPGRAGVEQDGCDMRNVSLMLLEETARMMALRTREVMSGDVVVNGRIDVYDGRTRQWVAFDPPR